MSPAVVLAPLGLEARYLRSGAPGLRVTKLGMGPRRAARTMTRVLVTAPETVVVGGVAGALHDRFAPGDLVAIERVLDKAGATVAELPLAARLVTALRVAGVPAAVGTVVTVDRVAGGKQRAALAALGADLVDMETSAVVASGLLEAGSQVVVLRAVSDTPSQPLASPAGLRGGRRALLSLRRAAPTLAAWAADAGSLAVEEPCGDGTDPGPPTEWTATRWSRPPTFHSLASEVH